MGFEPMKELLLYTLSKRALSTTQPSLQNILNKKKPFNKKNILKHIRFKDVYSIFFYNLIFYNKFIIS